MLPYFLKLKHIDLGGDINFGDSAILPYFECIKLKILNATIILNSPFIDGFPLSIKIR